MTTVIRESMRLDYDRFHVEPLTPRFGAEVVGVNMAEVDEELASLLTQAWLDWKVLFFRDQDITTPEHIAFGQHFGQLEIHPFLQDDEFAELVVLDTEGGGPVRASFWHTDVTFRECPPNGSILRGRVIPRSGGDTCWFDMERRYDALDDDMKQLLEDRTATHTLSRTFGRDLDPDERERKLAEFPDQHHPVVRTHPETGRKSLFVNRPFVQCIDGLEPEDSTRVLKELVGGSSYAKLEHQVRFRWQPNSFAMWDNRCTQHYALWDYDEHRRVERVTLAGEKPF